MSLNVDVIDDMIGWFRRLRGLAVPLLMALLLSMIFGLPHMLIPRLLGNNQPYTPFAISGVSASTYDETSLYAAQANYTYVRWKSAYDTDAFEYKEVPSVMSTAPHFAIAALSWIFGGVDRAFIACDFLLPALAFLLLFALLFEMTNDLRLSVLGAVVTLLLPFGPRNFIGSALEIVKTGSTSEIQPLEYSRLLHPQLSFTIFLAALLFLWRTLRYARAIDSVIAGFLGGLLFYTYIYYWLPWVGACMLLLFICSFLNQTYRTRLWTQLWIINGITWITGSFFWLTYFRAQQFPNSAWLLERFNLELGHHFRPEKLAYTLVYSVIFASFVLVFRTLVMPRTHIRTSTRTNTNTNEDMQSRNTTLFLFHGVIFLAAVGAFNLEIVTGRNILSLSHYPNKLFQPYLCIAMFTLVAPIGPLYLRSGSGGSGGSYWLGKSWKLLSLMTLIILLTFSALRQAGVAINTALKHEYKREHQLLFSWLNQNAGLDEVLITTDVEVNYLIPVYTHGRAFVPNGTRSIASNEEIHRRFLIAMKLLRHPEDEVCQILAQDATQGDQPLGLTYTFYLFLGGYGQINRRLPQEKIEKILGDYRRLDLAYELGRFRADYVYMRHSEKLQPVAGWRFIKVYANEYGSLAHIVPSSLVRKGVGWMEASIAN